MIRLTVIAVSVRSALASSKRRFSYSVRLKARIDADAGQILAQDQVQPVELHLHRAEQRDGARAR